MKITFCKSYIILKYKFNKYISHIIHQLRDYSITFLDICVPICNDEGRKKKEV